MMNINIILLKDQLTKIILKYFIVILVIFYLNVKILKVQKHKKHFKIATAC